MYETTFQDALVHPEHGLCVYIVDVSISTYLTRFIILKSPTLNLIELLDEVQRLRLNHAETITNNQRLFIGRQEMQSIINSMDMEWDKTCAKVLSPENKSIEEIKALGFDPDTMPRSIHHVT